MTPVAPPALVDADLCLKCQYLLRGLPRQGRCPECGEPYDVDQRIWRMGKTLVMLRGAGLPARCVKCNADVDTVDFKRKLTWHSPWLYLLLISLWVYIIVAVIVQKSAVVHVGLCPAHRASRRHVIVFFWACFVGSIGLTVLAVNYESGVLGACALLLFLIALLYALIRARIVTASRIDSNLVWISGVCADYLFDLPTLPAPLRSQR